MEISHLPRRRSMVEKLQLLDQVISGGKLSEI